MSWREERRRSTAIWAVSRAWRSGNRASRWAVKSGLRHTSSRMSWRYAMTAESVQRWRKTSRMVDRPSRLSVKAARVPSSSRSRTHWGSNAVQVWAGRVPSGHNKLNDGGFCIMIDHLPRPLLVHYSGKVGSLCLALLLHLYLDQPGARHGKMDGLSGVAPRAGRRCHEPTDVRIVRQAMTAWRVTVVM